MAIASRAGNSIRDSMTTSKENLLNDVFAATHVAAEASRSKIESFLGKASAWEALADWLGLDAHSRVPAKREILDRICVAIALLDAQIGDQLDVILHAPAMQKLEASWRGLSYLVDCIEDDSNVIVRILPISWRELVKDLERAIDFDQSQTFKKIYNEEFGTPGGEPYGILLADYELRHRPGPGHPTDDLGALRSLQQVAAASFAPLIAGLDPAFMGLDGFRDLERPVDLDRIFAGVEYTQWNSVRKSEDGRFVGLTLPRVLARLPHRDDSLRADGFCYEEDVSDSDGSGYTWGTAVYAFGSVVMRAFTESGWLAGIRGVERDVEGGGLVTGLPLDDFETDLKERVLKSSTDVIITDTREKELADLGFIPLSHCHGTGLAAFYSNQSIQKPRRYDDAGATVNAKLSAMLQYMLCVSRFAHYIKVIGRDKVGAFTTAEECEHYLNNWLIDYSTSSEDSSTELQAKYPLREGRVKIKELPGQPGVFSSVIHLRPHFQLDEMSSSVKLVTELFEGVAN
ncbi:MAG: type VI secretion system protein ImpD [Planctomycetota bacterium]